MSPTDAPADPEILRLTAFTDDPHGGNPAGVVTDATGLDAATMQQIAADVGYSETAFLVDRGGGTYDARYFSPGQEVPFCGHATIASAVAVAGSGGDAELVFRTAAGDVPITVRGGKATLTSVTPHVEPIADADLDEALGLLRWTRADLDPALPPRFAYAGARHLVLAAATRERLADLDYDFDGLAAWMTARDLITVDLVHRTDATTFRSRNPFPVGGVVEDPATGAAAAAFGAYLREVGAVTPPASIVVHQGEDMGRPSRIEVQVDADRPEIAVSGGAVPVAGAAPVA